MIDFKKSHQHVCSCACVCVWGGGEGEVFHITHSLASHTLCREREAATIKLSPRQKLDVANQIHALRRSHPLPWSTSRLVDVSILLPNHNGQ